MEGSCHGLIEVLSHFGWGLRKTTKALRLASIHAEIKTERLPSTSTEPFFYACACCWLGSVLMSGYVKLREI